MKLETIVNYFWVKEAFDQALSLINLILTSSPRSVLGLMFVRGLQKAMENIGEALSSYEKAREEFIAQDPDFCEPPRVIDVKNAELREASGEDEER
jgi:hypothetical protein